MTTGFKFDEKCPWHSTGAHMPWFPPGGFVQPPSGSGHGESRQTKRRFKNRLQVSGQAIPVGDLMTEIILAQQPKADFVAFQRARLEAQARAQFG